MGKNRDRESLIRLLVNITVHEIVMKNTNRPESKHFLSSEIIEYSGQTEKMKKLHIWNEDDKTYIKEKALRKIKEKMNFKYPDILFSIKEAENLLDKKINEMT